jgi:ribosomal protein S11
VRLVTADERRTKVVGAFPDRASALRLITAVALKVTAIRDLTLEMLIGPDLLIIA